MRWARPTDQVSLRHRAAGGQGVLRDGDCGRTQRVSGVCRSAREFAGVDQVNVLLPASLAGEGNVNVQLTAGGTAANPVQVTIQ